MTSLKTIQYIDTPFYKKHQLKYIILLCLFFQVIFQLDAAAQTKEKEVPTNDRDVFYLYTEFALQNSSKVKIMLITSCIYRYKYGYGYNAPALSSNVIETRLINELNAKADEIQSNEFNSSIPLHSKQIYNVPSTIKAISAFTSNGIAQGFCPVTTYKTISSATAYLKICRDMVINDYKARGYTVLQVNLSDDFSADTKGIDLEEVEWLSPLIISRYSTGVMRRMAAPYQVSAATASSAQKKSSSKLSSTIPSTQSDDDGVAQIKLKIYNASLYELEGDRLYKMGGLFYAEATKNYQMAQSIYYNDRVKQKIDNINTTIATAKAIDDGMNKVNDNINKAVANLDPSEKTKFNMAWVNYEGLAGNYDKITNHSKQSPYAVFLGFTGHRVCISFESRIGYVQSLAYEYNIERNNSGNSMMVDKVSIQQQGIGGGLSLGLNLPIKRRVVLYGLCGFDIGPLTIDKRIVSDGAYILKDSPDFPLLNFKLSLGMDFIIPKTSVGIGARYNINSLSGIKDSASEIANPHDSNTSNHYYLKSTTDANYKYNNIGVRFFWLVK